MTSLESILGGRFSPGSSPVRLSSSSSSSSSSSLSSSYLNDRSAIGAGGGAGFKLNNNYTTNENLLQAKIDYLEKNRSELSEKLHRQNEQERTLRIKIELLEVQLKSTESSRGDLHHQSESSARDLQLLQAQKDELETEVKRLKASALGNADAGIWSKMTAATRELRRIEAELSQAHIEKELLLHEKEELNKNIDQLNQESLSKDMSIRIQTKTSEEARAKCTSLELKLRETDVIKRQKEELEVLYNSAKLAHEEFRLQHESEIEELTAKIAVLEEQLEESLATPKYPTVSSECNSDMMIDGEAALVISNLRKKLNESEDQRRKLHNKLQDLRGNIRVYVRCRPFLKLDNEGVSGGGNEESCIRCNMDGNSIQIAGSGRGAGQIFSFDQVFRPDSTQEDVYKNVSDLVQSSLDGYNVCIFSYGQTGSGKTHTMNGERRGGMRGIIPRAVEQILKHSFVMQEEGWRVELSASIIEIYNEDLKDLLSNSKDQNNNKDKLQIRHANGKTQVIGATSFRIGTENVFKGLEQLEKLLDQATKARKTASTDMNETSSRSHVIFMLDTICTHATGNTVLTGGLRLIDLAGSERLDRTGTANDATRLKETVNINKSLSCLADVFIALGNKSSHIPFRNSKLTMLLQDCLSGDGKALMFVNVSPTQASASETLNSLRFATQANQIEMGKAQRQIYAIAPPPAPVSLVAQPSHASVSSNNSSNNSNSNTNHLRSSVPSAAARAGGGGSGANKQSTMAGTSNSSDMTVGDRNDNAVATAVVSSTLSSSLIPRSSIENRIPFSNNSIDHVSVSSSSSSNRNENIPPAHQNRVAFQMQESEVKGLNTSMNDNSFELYDDCDLSKKSTGSSRSKTSSKRKSISMNTCPQNLVSSSTSFIPQSSGGSSRLSSMLVPTSNIHSSLSSSGNGNGNSFITADHQETAAGASSSKRQKKEILVPSGKTTGTGGWR